MKFFIDTANLSQIKEAQVLGVLDGVTTNPSLMAKEGITGKNNILKHYVDICNLVDGDVSAEVNALDYDGMIKEGVDIPHLDRGTDVSPRSDGVQIIGRIRRRLKDKSIPVWMTIRDRSSEALVRITADRIRDYKTSRGVEVIEDGRL